MSNQFDSRLYWWRAKVWAHDEATGAVCVIEDTFDKSEKPWAWRVVAGRVRSEGRGKSEQACRGAVRRAVLKLKPKADH